MKSVFTKLYLAVFCALALTPWLAGCDAITSYQPPHAFGGNEVPAAAMNEPRLVTTAVPGASDHAAWPRVGDVPAKPNNFTPLPMVDQTMTEMETDRAVAEQKKQEVENPVPPPYTASPYIAMGH